jgi:hypothetical protein
LGKDNYLTDRSNCNKDLGLIILKFKYQ